MGLALPLLLVTVACGDDDDAADDDPSDLPVVGEGDVSATGTVGPEGGVVRLASGSAVVIPPGALSTPVQISVSSSVGLPVGVDGPLDGPIVGEVLTTEPHGLQFDAPVEIRIATPAGLPGSRLALYTHDVAADTWAEHDDLTLGTDGSAVARTTHFSHWGWRAAPGGAAAIPDGAVIDIATGYAFYAAYNPPGGFWEIRRAALTAGASYDTLYIEPPGVGLSVLSAGPEGLFFFRQDVDTIARMSTTGAGLVREWANVPGFSYFSAGFQSLTHLYVGSVAIPFDTGVPAPLEFNAGGCAVTADRTRAACRGGEVDLATGVLTVTQDGVGWNSPNGEVVTDATHWYFASQQTVQDGIVVKVAHGATTGVRFIDHGAPTEHVALYGTTLFIGNSDSITAYDTTTGGKLGAVSLAVEAGASALLATDGTTLFHATYGGTLQRTPVSAVIP